jgi:hypothetical protein
MFPNKCYFLLNCRKNESLIEYITICNGVEFWEETLSENHRNSKNPLTLWELPLALTTVPAVWYFLFFVDLRTVPKVWYFLFFLDFKTVPTV